MSKAINAVLDRSEARGLVLLVHIALARHVRDRGGSTFVYPSREKLAKMARSNKANVSRALRSLVDLGEVVDTGQVVGKGVRVYRLTMVEKALGGVSREHPKKKPVGSRQNTPTGVSREHPEVSNSYRVFSEGSEKPFEADENGGDDSNVICIAARVAS